MKARNLFIGVLATVFTSSCSTTKVVTDQNLGKDFSAIKSYQIVLATEDGKKNILENDLNRVRIEESLTKQLNARGLEKAENPDVYIVYQTGVDQSKSYHTSSNYHTPYYGRRGYYYGGMSSGHSTTTESITNNGNLTVSMHCPESDELLWYSSGTKEIKGNGKKKEKKIDEAIEKIMEEFPLQKIEELASSQ